MIAYFVVRAKGLEPPHLAMPEPKSGASTNSATPAYEKLPFNKRREPLTGKPRRGKGEAVKLLNSQKGQSFGSRNEEIHSLWGLINS